jgi:lipoprotein-anchoring transpeptidase ErfK/SrfK
MAEADMRETGWALAAAVAAAALAGAPRAASAQVMYNAPPEQGAGRVVGPPRGGSAQPVAYAPQYGYAPQPYPAPTYPAQTYAAQGYAPQPYAPAVVPNYGPAPTAAYGYAPMAYGPTPTATYGRMAPPDAAAPIAPAPRRRSATVASYAPVAYQPASYEPAGGAPDLELDARPQRAVSPRYQRTEVAYDGPHAPGTLIVDTPSRHLFLVQPGGRAIRYGIGVGRPGFEWSGVKHVSRKAQWPDWRPPPEMLKRRPELPTFMAGGPKNPLGARALYLGSSMYRIHGTNEPHTIGQNVSSGCIRMMNEDVIDLYDRVPVGARVIVI